MIQKRLRLLDFGVPMLQTISTEQEHLRRALTRIGPVIGGSDPNIPKGKQPIVSAPIKMSRDDWQDRITTHIQKSALVVLRIAITPGILWEFQEAIKKVPAQRLVFLVPSQAEYESFVALYKGVFPFALPPFSSSRRPPKGSVTAIIYFRSNWQPCFVPLEIPRWRGETLTAALIHAMKPIYEQLGMPWKRAPISAWKVMMASYVALLVAFILYALTFNQTSSDSESPTADTCSAIKAGRSTLKVGLSPSLRERCCAKQPWLMGC